MSEVPALVGRREEIAALTRAVEDLGAGRGTVLEVAGDPGIGKTALLNLLARLAVARGATVLRARARAGAGARSGEVKPYQVFRDAWQRSEPSMATPHSPAAEAGPPWDTAVDHELVRALLEGCARRDGGRGSVLVLDDVHHADPASAQLLEALAEECAAHPLVLAFGLRPRQTPPALLAALDDASHTGRLVRVEPAPLDAAAIASLAGRGRVEELVTGSSGNPRALRVLLAAGHDPGQWPARSDAAAGPLLRAAAPVLAELEALPGDCAEVLAAAAVLGEPFRPGDAAHVAGYPGDRTAAALGTLAAADLIRSDGPAGTLVFRHPVLGHLLHHRMNPGLRHEAHHRALGLLDARGAASAARARHAEHVLPAAADPARVLRVLADGAAEVLAREPATAARWLRLTLEYSPTARTNTNTDTDTDTAAGVGVGARARLALDCCRALTAAGRPQEARALAHELLRTPGVLPGRLRTEALAVCVGIERLLGRYEEADATARTVVDALARPLSAPLPIETAGLVFDYGLLHALRGTVGEVRGLAHEAARAVAGADEARADEAGADEAGRTALGVLAAFCDSYVGDFTRAAPEVARCARLVDSRPDTVAGRAPEVLALLGCAELFVERFADARRHLSRGLATAGGGAHKHIAVNQLLGLSILDQWAGRLDTAQRHAREAERLAGEIGAPDAAGLAIALRSSALLWAAPRRRTPEAVELAEAGLRATVPGTGWWAGSALGLLAVARLMGGDPAACLRTLLEGGGEDLVLLQPPSRPSLFALMTTAAAQCGDLAAAARAAHAADAAAARLGRPAFQQAQADRAGAALALAQGDPARAATLSLDAARAFKALRMPVLRAWTLIAATPALAATHGRAAALGPLDEALEAARQCGALRLCEDGARARAALTATTTTATSTTPSCPPGPLAALSVREREVAELAAAGLSSRQVAERLVLSTRTIDTHLGNAYRKLGVSSRVALTRLFGPPPGGPGGPVA
ncbi:AAA family ATPase [Streptomyces sp. NPDC056402]|uniref:helix-turn-helix transcriptional regulator n=1 Tax=Streptomyces sp. NPDC056402 TaxID=3345810 RepID=UPI0035DE6580